MARFIISREKAVERYNKLKELTDFISYSSKTNQTITRILHDETDCFFSVHLENELKHIKDKSRVIFLAQGWDENSIERLINMGIRFFAVDNTVDLEILKRYIQEKGVRINLLLRMKLKENTLRTERHFVFGMESDMIKEKVREMKPLVEKLGIHFHRKTQNMSEWNLKFELEHTLDEDTLEKIDYMDIGGGLPSEYKNTNMKVIGSIFPKIKKFKEWLDERDIKMIIEPGRYISAPSVKLETNILRIYDNNIIIDASVYNSDMDALIVPIKLKVEGELNKEKGEPYVIKGITPCSTDLFRYRVYLKNPKEGDTITFINAGAYNFRSNFCDLGKIEEVIE
ncbi:MAG: decarboxylase [Nanobdellota archaeon]